MPCYFQLKELHAQREESEFGKGRRSWICFTTVSVVDVDAQILVLLLWLALLSSCGAVLSANPGLNQETDAGTQNIQNATVRERCVFLFLYYYCLIFKLYWGFFSSLMLWSLESFSLKSVWCFWEVVLRIHCETSVSLLPYVNIGAFS